MMQFVHQETITKKIQIKKRTSSANFHSKKIKNILTTRQTCDQITVQKQKQTQLPATVSSKTLNYHRKGKSYLQTYNRHVNNKKVANKALLQIIKPVKYEKSKEENLLLKYCDKSKLIYWSKDIKLQGREKYLLISADLLIDQDCFWEKISTDNVNFTTNIQNNNNFTSVNYNSTTLSRNRNINPPLPPKFVPLNNNVGLNSQKQSKRNPLMNPNRVNFLIRQWKNLHNKIDSDNRKIVVLWLIRKQSTYGYLVEFAQTFQLPLHGIFYVKRKRTNSMFDLGLIVKEINQKFFQSIINLCVHTIVQKQSPKTLKSIQKNTDFKGSKSKQMKRFVKKQSHQMSIQMKIKNNNSNFNTHKFIKSTKQTPVQENDQNCAQNMNLQTCKQFELSKNINGNKKPLISIIMDEKRVKNIVKKVTCASEVIKNRPGTTIKISQTISKTQTIEKSSKRYISPLITDDQNNTQQIQQLEQNLLQMIEQEKEQIGYCLKERYLKPQIYLFEGLKCNLKDYSDIDTYNGKMPLMFNYHQERYREIKQKLSKQGIQIQEGDHQIESNVKIFYLKYESIKQNPLERINSLVRQIVIKNVQPQSNNNLFYLNNKVSQFLQQTITNIFLQYHQHMKKTKQPQVLNKQPQQSQPSQQQQQSTLTQQQQQQIIQKTQKRLQQIKKQLINDVITMKGRNYTFENGQSVYYYVGGVFKRNYNLLYNQYYAKYQNQMRGQLMMNNKQQISNKKYLEDNNQQLLNDLAIPKLSTLQFYQMNNC